MQTKNKGPYFVYMVRCKHGTYYSGYTVDLEARISLHNSGKGAKYLRGRAPVELVYERQYRDLSDALKAERELKNLKRHEKEALAGEYAKKQIQKAQARET
jgi:putative endonuclease